jgi:hypothetical protein
MKRLLTIALAVVAFAAFGATTTHADSPSFDSDCVGTQWVIRNRGLEPFNVGTPSGDIYMAVDAVWAPPANLDSVTISDTVIIRGSCEVFAAPTRLPDTGAGAQLTLAVLAAALIALGAAALRVGRN